MEVQASGSIPIADRAGGEAGEPVGTRHAPEQGRSRTLDRADLAFLALCVVAGAILLGLSRDLTFFWDEWVWIGRHDPWALDSLMTPYNQHWLVGFLVIYEALLSTVGMASYLPAMAVLIGFHLLAAWLLFRLLRRSFDAWMAAALGAILLLYGNGHQDLLWAANIMFTAACAIGLGALGLVLDVETPRRPRLLALLLLLLVTLGGVGLLFVGCVTVVLLTTRARRHALWVVVPAGVAWATWYAIWGRGGAAELEVGPGMVRGALLGAWEGARAAAGHLVGASGAVGAAFLALLLIGVLWTVVRRRGVPDLMLVALAGFCGIFLLVGAARSEGEVLQSRHQYVAMVFLLLLIGSLVRELAGAGVPRRALIGGAWLLAIVSVAQNVPVLVEARDWYLARADGNRARVGLLLDHAGSPAFPLDRIPGGSDAEVGTEIVGSPARLRELVERYGSPLTDAVWGTRPVPDAQLDGVLFRLVRDQLVPAVEPGAPPTRQLPELLGAHGATTAVVDGCLAVTATADAPGARVAAAGGSSLLLWALTDTLTRVQVGLRGALPTGFQLDWTWRDGFLEVPVTGGRWTSLALPDLATDDAWQVRVALPAGGTVSVCLAPPPAGALGGGPALVASAIVAQT